MRQLGRPALLVATCKGDASGVATAAMAEVEVPLLNCLHELSRVSLTLGGAPCFEDMHMKQPAASSASGELQVASWPARGMSHRSHGWIEVPLPLLNCLHELSRVSLTLGGALLGLHARVAAC